jgi:hypothetical protein
MTLRSDLVIPKKAGIQRLLDERLWVPALAGTTLALWKVSLNSATSVMSDWDKAFGGILVRDDTCVAVVGPGRN